MRDLEINQNIIKVPKYHDYILENLIWQLTINPEKDKSSRKYENLNLAPVAP